MGNRSICVLACERDGPRGECCILGGGEQGPSASLTTSAVASQERRCSCTNGERAGEQTLVGSARAVRRWGSRGSERQAGRGASGAARAGGRGERRPPSSGQLSVPEALLSSNAAPEPARQHLPRKEAEGATQLARLQPAHCSIRALPCRCHDRSAFGTSHSASLVYGIYVLTV
jgi:hypothetical protein